MYSVLISLLHCSPCATVVVGIQSSAAGSLTGTASRKHIYILYVLSVQDKDKSQGVHGEEFISFFYFTFLHTKAYVDLVVIEPSWDLHPAAISASIPPLSVQDGQGHVSVRQPPMQLVPIALPVGHPAVLGGQDCVATFGHGHLPSSPAEARAAACPGVVATGQSHIVPDLTEDFEGGGGRCGDNDGHPLKTG